MDDVTTLKRLVEVLRLLASEYEVQKAAISANVLLADEIALLFDDLWQHCEFLRNRKILTVEQLVDISEINTILDFMSQSKELWTDIALESNEKWKDIRRHSMNAIKKIGEEYRPPVIDWVQFEKS